MIIRRTLEVARPRPRIFDYLSDFTTTTEWDPGTISTVRLHGDGGIGTRYENRSRFLGRTTTLTYTVVEAVPGERISLRGENDTVQALDTITLRSTPTGTEVRYVARFRLRGAARVVAPLLAPAFWRLGRQAEAGLREALLAL